MHAVCMTFVALYAAMARTEATYSWFTFCSITATTLVVTKAFWVVAGVELCVDEVVQAFRCFL